MNLRSIKKVMPAFKVDMGGIVLDQSLPAQGVDQIDPFLLVHHLELSYDAGTDHRTVGVGPHPHRGFAPVTFVFQGGVHHRDSLNTSSIIYKGGTQWMNAGKGIVHSERPPLEVARDGGTWEIIQFWVNVPSKYKMKDPYYKGLTYEDTPSICSPDGLVKLGVVCGDYYGTKGKVESYTPIQAFRLEFEKGGEIKIPIPKDHNAFVYQLDGQLKINDNQTIVAKDLTWLENDGDEITLKALENTRAIVLAGVPIKEEIATYGPFVMNTQAEILQAMRDYQKGDMGQLVENFD